MYNVKVIMCNGEETAWRVDSLEEIRDEIAYTVRRYGNISSITIQSPEILL